jgi:integrase/recombinase XerC
MRSTTIRRRSIDRRLLGGGSPMGEPFTSPSKDLVDYRYWMESSDRMRPNSVAKRMKLLARVEVALGHPLLKATTVELRIWLDGFVLGTKSRYSYISHLSQFWRWALAEERATTDPASRLTRPRLRPDLPRPISTAELAMLIEQAPNAEIRAMVTLGGYAGLRCMEIAGLRACDLMPTANPPILFVADGKGGRQRIVPMSPAIIAALHAHGVPRSGPVFPDRDGIARGPWRVSHLLRAHMHACGLKASAHQLRHTFATEVYRQSRDLRMTQQLLGHSSPATTALYTQWAQDEAAGVVAALFT